MKHERRKGGDKMSKMVYLRMFTSNRKKEKRRVPAGTLRSIIQKQEKVEAGTEQSSCRTASSKRNARMESRKQVLYVRTNEPIKQWSWPEPQDDNAFTNYGSLAEFVANNSTEGVPYC